MAATAHGSADPSPRSWAAVPVRASAVAPAGVPQRWQNLAPGVSSVPQAPQRAPASGTPQFEQNFPDAGDWQPGQVASDVEVAGLVMW